MSGRGVVTYADHSMKNCTWHGYIRPESQSNSSMLNGKIELLDWDSGRIPIRFTIFHGMISTSNATSTGHVALAAKNEYVVG